MGVDSSLSSIMRRCAAVVVLGLACLLTTSCRHEARHTSAAQEHNSAARGCRVTETGRQKLTIDHQPVYIEANVLVENRSGDVLLLGYPNYLFDPAGTDADDNAIAGALLPRNGEVRAVHLPQNAGTVRPVGGTVSDDGGWDVLFVEHARATAFPPPDSADQLWYGRYDGSRWVRWEVLPALNARGLRPHLSSPPVSQGDTLAWAIGGSEGIGGGLGGVAIFERRNDRWEYQFIEILGAAYARLAWVPRLGTVLAVVQKHNPMPGAEERSSVVLYASDQSWDVVGRMLRDSAQNVYGPILDAVQDGVRLTWWSLVEYGHRLRREARSSVYDSDVPPVTVDSSTAEALVSIPSVAGAHLWVSDHDPATSSREIRFIREVDGRPDLIARFPNPFTGGFSAIALSSTEVWVLGPLLDREGAPPLVTLILRYEITCPGHP